MFPQSCAEVSQNTITEGIIGGMDPKFKVIRDPTCGVANGVLFWLGWFTSEQVKTLRGGGEAVRAVVKNIKAESDSPTKVKRNGPKRSKRNNIAESFDSGAPEAHIPELKVEHAFGIPNAPIGHAGTLGLDKRASFPVLRRQVDDSSLNHLSTAPGRTLKKYYTFFREAGEDVLVIVLEASFPDVFSNIDTGRIRSGDIEFLHSPAAPDEQSLGECTVDKIGGELFGVATNSQFALFEVSPDLASFLPALVAIAVKVRDGQIVPLNNGMVMNVRMRFQPEDTEEQELADIMAERISALLTAGIIFVGSAGASGDETVVTTYPGKLSTRLPIITVGVVAPYTGIANGPRGPEVTVYSVILGQCYPVLYGRGAGMAVATVTGLAAYFLSLPDLHARFGPPGLDRSRKLIAYLQLMSYQREPVSPGSVWNGHDNEDGSIWYGNGPLNPPTHSN